jgi:precorrin-3B synthase
MNTHLVRGACPTLAAPMATGDGLLVRLGLAEGGMSAEALTTLCRLAMRHGNGIVEVTARGNLQIRGLTSSTAPHLATQVEALGLDLAAGLPVETSPLGGLDPGEIADPRPLGRALRMAVAKAGLADSLGPKVSVVVDGGGAISLARVPADIRLTALRIDGVVGWQLALDGKVDERPLFVLKEANAVPAVLAVLAMIAAIGRKARARDLAREKLDAIAPAATSGACPSPVASIDHAGHCPEEWPSRLRLMDDRLAMFVGLPFGSIQAEKLVAFLDAVDPEEIRLAPQRSLILICRNEEEARRTAECAPEFGLIVDASDPRRTIFACPGAPACASARITAREIGQRLAGAIAPGLAVHVSGCAKGCAHSAPTDLVFVGTDAGIGIIRNGRAGDAPFAHVADAEAALALLQEQTS